MPTEILPRDSLLQKVSESNYTDIFTYTVENAEKLSPDDIQLAFWTYQPKWLEYLFKLRNILVKPFGLQTETEDKEQYLACIKNGGKCKYAEVEKSVNENLLCLIDKHLLAYISVYVEDIGQNKQKVYVTTKVQLLNKFGYLYFYTILPFHKIIVKIILKKAVDKVAGR